MKTEGIASLLLQLAYVLLGLVGCFWCAWWVLSSLDFHYSFWYQALNIGPFIAEYGPQNRYKLGLENCTSEQHIALFQEIAQAIQHPKGLGLEFIRYCDDQGFLLLRAPEILHLQDVAHLVNKFHWFGGILCLVWVLSAVLLVLRFKLPCLNRVGLLLLSSSLLVSSFVMLIGPVEIFYTFHEWIFPKDTPWFFYYQDSLMTTLMKAPDLFGGIAVSWSVIAILLFLWIHFGLQFYSKIQINDDNHP